MEQSTKQDVVITIQVKQEFDEEEIMELVTQGTMEEQAEGMFLSYEESEMTGLQGTTTSFLVEAKRIRLTRVGSIRSLMVFEEGHRHKSSYEMPYGAMEVEVHTTALEHNLSKDGGEIHLDYNIEISKNIVGSNFFHIKVSLPQKSTAL